MCIGFLSDFYCRLSLTERKEIYGQKRPKEFSVDFQRNKRRHFRKYSSDKKAYNRFLITIDFGYAGSTNSNNKWISNEGCIFLNAVVVGGIFPYSIVNQPMKYKACCIARESNGLFVIEMNELNKQKFETVYTTSQDEATLRVKWLLSLHPQNCSYHLFQMPLLHLLIFTQPHRRLCLGQQNEAEAPMPLCS